MPTTLASTVVLYRTEQSATLLTTLAAASAEGGRIHAHGPALHGDRGSEVAETVVAVAESREVQALVWDGDAPTQPDGVGRIVAETAADLLVVEWQPRMIDGHLDLARRLLDDPPCDVLMVRPGSLARVDGITVAVGPGPNAPLVAGLGLRWAEAFGVPAVALRGVDAAEDLPEAEALCARLAPGMATRLPVGRDLVNLLVEEADRSGFLALGATEGFPFDRLGVRTVGVRLANRADATIVVGRRAAD
jgi:hypothetical protein